MISCLLRSKGFFKIRPYGKGEDGTYTLLMQIHIGAQILENSFQSVLKKH